MNYGKTASDRTDKFSQVLKAAYNKFTAGNKFEKLSGEKPESLKNAGYMLSPPNFTLKVSGVGAFYLKKFIEYISSPIITKILGGDLVVHIVKKDWLLKEMKTSKKLDLFISFEYGKKSVKGKLTGLVLVEAASKGVDPKSLSSLSPNLKPGDIKSAIKAELAKNK